MPQEFNGLCESIIKALIKWPSLMASLQAGKGEINKAGIIENALWGYCASGQIVLMEYRDIDYAIVQKDSICSPRLTVDAIFECKFNYATQLGKKLKDGEFAGGEFRKRLLGHTVKGEWKPSAFKQASNYRDDTKANETAPSAFVLYLTASPWVNPLPKKPKDGRKRDTGFGYFCCSREEAEDFREECNQLIEELVKEADEKQEKIAKKEECHIGISLNNHKNGCFLSCYLFEFTSQEPYKDPQRPK